MGHTESGSRRTGGVTMRGTCAALSAAQRAYVAHDPYWPMRLPAWTPPGPAAWPCATPRGRRSPRCAGGGKALHQRGPRQPQDAGRQPRARDNSLSGHDQRARRGHGSGAAATTDRPPWCIGRMRRGRFAPGQRGRGGGREGIPRPPRAVADGDSVTAACMCKCWLTRVMVTRRARDGLADTARKRSRSQPQ